jgi:hypothetical protein
VGPKPHQEAALGPGPTLGRVDVGAQQRPAGAEVVHPIDPQLPDPPAKGLDQPSGELVRHRTRPGDPTEASRQAEGLRVPDLNGKVPVACHLLEHDVLVERLVVSRAKPDDLGDPHLDVADLGGSGHGDLLPHRAKAILLP